MKRSFAFTGNSLIITTALFLSVFYNSSYYLKILELFPAGISNSAFLFSVFGLQLSATILLISLFSIKGLLKPFLILLLLTSAISSYLMDSFGTIVSPEMIEQVFNLSNGKFSEFISIYFFLYFILLGIIPALFILRLPIKFKTIKAEFIARLQLVVLALSGAILIILMFYPNYNSIFRASNSAKYYANPIYFISSGIDSLIGALSTSNNRLNTAGEDAIIVEMDNDRELVILVLGEAARADRFSLNGYERDTNPLLQQHDMISFKDFSACGTSTSVSVECIFSDSNIVEPTSSKHKQPGNIIDVFNYAGINVLWRDNNKRVMKFADKIDYQNFRNPDINPVCDSECRDEGMLHGLQEYIESQKSGDIFIVLHQIGSQGPAYYKRYPKSFEVFTPTCQTSLLVKCTQQEINNAYDNTIRYTDYFLAKTIDLLKQNESDFETALLYVSDHGESLGEKGVYLHGLPTFIAPKKQTHVASVLWISDNFHHVNKANAIRKSETALSHDNLFHTLLGLFEIQTKLYNPSLDILSNSW